VKKKTENNSDRQKRLFSIAGKFHSDEVQQVPANPIRGKTETGQAFEISFLFLEKEPLKKYIKQVTKNISLGTSFPNAE
jgi:hypothetical protein